MPQPSSKHGRQLRALTPLPQHSVSRQPHVVESSLFDPSAPVIRTGRTADEGVPHTRLRTLCIWAGVSILFGLACIIYQTFVTAANLFFYFPFRCSPACTQIAGIALDHWGIFLAALLAQSGTQGLFVLPFRPWIRSVFLPPAGASPLLAGFGGYPWYLRILRNRLTWVILAGIACWIFNLVNIIQYNGLRSRYAFLPTYGISIFCALGEILLVPVGIALIRFIQSRF